MSELRDLYQELILEHSKSPRNFHTLDDRSHESEGFNPLCGDHIWIHLRLDGDTVAEVTFQGSGCAICTASASVMTGQIKGRTTAEVEALFHRFHDLVTGRSSEGLETLGKLAVFAGVSEFPVRVKCASLPWHTLTAALRNQAEAVSTED